MTAKRPPVRRPRRSNSDKFFSRLQSVAKTSYDEPRKERLQKRARTLVDPDAVAREAHFFFKSMELLATAVPESMTCEEILDAASRVRTVRRRVVARKSDIPDTIRRILKWGWEHAVLGLPRHEGVTRHDLGLIEGWSWHEPDMPGSEIPEEIKRLMGGEIEDFLRWRVRLRQLDGRQSKHTQEALIEAIAELRKADPGLVARLEAEEKGRFAVQSWQLKAVGHDEEAALADGQSIRTSRRRDNRPVAAGPCRILEDRAGVEIRPAKKGSSILIRGYEPTVFDATRAGGKLDPIGMADDGWQEDESE
jgi:hypothetical protein